jgi:hypothetical protein
MDLLLEVINLLIYSLQAVVTKEEVRLYDVSANNLLRTLEGTFNEGPHLLKFHPARFCMTYSTGPTLLTYVSTLYIPYIITK